MGVKARQGEFSAGKAVATGMALFALLFIVEGLAVLGIRGWPWSASKWFMLVGIDVGTLVLVGLFLWAQSKPWSRQPAFRLLILIAYAALCQVLLVIVAADKSKLANWTILPLLMPTALFAIGWTQIWRRWLFWRQMDTFKESKASILIGAIGALLILTIVFSGITACLVAKGIIDPKPPLRGHIFARVEEQYAWNFLDAWPGLKVPDTLNWKLRNHMTDHVAGALFLTYKILVILPVITAITLLWARRGGQHADAPAESRVDSGASDVPQQQSIPR